MGRAFSGYAEGAQFAVLLDSAGYAGRYSLLGDPLFRQTGRDKTGRFPAAKPTHFPPQDQNHDTGIV